MQKSGKEIVQELREGFRVAKASYDATTWRLIWITCALSIALVWMIAFSLHR